MIPRTRQPAPIPESNVPQDLPPIEHTAVDVTYMFVGGHSYSFSIIDGVGSIEEREDRYILSEPESQVEILKSGLLMIQRIERTWQTDPPLYTPRA